MNSILLVGAALAGLPILLHLIMKQEPKRLPFPAFRFLKQKQRINQRKMRLRHFILLALRVLLILLFAFTLYQPTLLSEGLNIHGEQPVAVVIVVDTSPSMGYVFNEKSRLEDAKIRALELLDELPDRSKVAIVETGEPGGEWLRSIGDARERVKKWDKPSGVSQSVTTALTYAYALFKTVDQESESTEPLPRLVVVFTDRATACWDASRTEELKKLRDSVPDPKPVQAVVDVGVDQPANVAIVSGSISPQQVVPGNTPAIVAVTVAALGTDAEAGVRVKLDASPTPERTVVPVPAGQSRGVTFEFRDLKPGLHQVEISLETPDKLLFDSTRYLTFRVAEPRKILTITDDPDDAKFWDLAHQAKGDFACEIMTPVQAVAADWRAFELVCLLSVADPNKPAENPLWAKLRKYVQAGGKLLLMPGGDDHLVLDAYDPTKPSADDAANQLMPGTLKSVVESRDGATWLLDDAALGQPMLADFRKWKAIGNIDVLKNPRRARKFWDVEVLPQGRVIVRYDDPDPKKRHPAVLERDVGKGRVVLLTTRMDVPWEKERAWNDYWETVGSSWFAVFPNLLVKYLIGDSTEANFNFATGQTVPISLGSLGDRKVDRLILEGPGLTSQDDTYIRLAANQKELRVGPPRTLTPGNFTVSVEEKDAGGTVRPRVIDGFSLNVPAEESVLEKVAVDVIEELTGKNSVFAIDKNLKLREVIDHQFPQPIDLFPWLLIGVLLLLAGEGLMANRFYRVKR